MIRVTKLQIPTLPTQEPRRLYVYLPRGYSHCEQRYPVLYMFDGHNVFYDTHATYGKSWGMKEYLEKTGIPLILVAVECNPEGFQRLSEYSPWSFHAPRPVGDVRGKGEITMDWFTQSLKPEIDRTYRTFPDREHTMIAGSSMGGLMAIYAVVAYNAVFSGAAALSPSLWVKPNGMAEMIRTHPITDPTRVYLDMGTGETDGSTIPLIGMFETAKRLSKAGAFVSANVIPGALHREADWEKRIPAFLQYLL